jgi:hypothetical protein
MRRFLALPLCLLVAACGSALPHRRVSQADPAPRASPWPDTANYNAIVTAVEVRDHALHLKAWNQKAYAAQLALETLVTLEGTMRPGKCARFVAHIYDELTDLNQAYAGEDWHPMVVVVAHDRTVASQCRASDPRPPFKLPATMTSALES